MLKKTIKRYGSIIVLLTILMIIYLILNNIPSIKNFVAHLFAVIFPFILGLIFALVLLPLCNRFEKILLKFQHRKKGFVYKHIRGISVFLTYIIVFIIIALLCKFAIPTIYQNVVEFLTNIPGYYNNIVEYFSNIQEDSIFYQVDFTNILNETQKYFDIKSIITYIKGVIDFASAIFSLFVAIILSIYTLIYRAQIINFIDRFLKVTSTDNTRNTVIKYIYKMSGIFSSFISGQFIDAIFIGTVTGIALLLLNVKYALALGFLIGVANMIPYFGAIFAAIFAVLVTLATGGIWQALTVLILILVLQQIDANIVNPKILSENLKINPMLVIFAVTVGGGFFGIIGMFLGVPVIAVVKAMVDDYIENKEKILN